MFPPVASLEKKYMSLKGFIRSL